MRRLKNNMKNVAGELIKITAFFICLTGLTTVTHAEGAGVSGGGTLLLSAGARPSGMGESFTAMTDDITAYFYNPASLSSLKSGQASILYNRGLSDDNFGQFMLGAPLKNGAFGLSVGYYNAGDIELFDGNQTTTVNAQTDLTATLGYSQKIKGVSLGLAGKFISSELIEQESGRAYAVDIGLSAPVGSKLQLGAALQNYGTELKYVEVGDELPRRLSIGATYSLRTGGVPTILSIDAPYYMNEKELRVGAGLEVSVGLLSIRGGYKHNSGLNEFSIGAGFLLGRTSFDYAFGMVNELNSEHRVSLSTRWGNGAPRPELVKKLKQLKPTQEEKQNTLGSIDRRGIEVKQDDIPPVKKSRKAFYTKKTKSRQIYTVKSGDTLAKISKNYYGKRGQWKKIFVANRHLLDSVRDLKVGQNLIIP